MYGLYNYLPPADFLLINPRRLDMDAPVYKEAEQALKVAKITLMMQKNTVCYTTVVFSLKQEITADIPNMTTAATDGKHLYIHPDFFMGLSPNERLTLLAHEALHVLLDHMHRKGDRDHKLFNIAADYVINGSLVNAQYALPKGGLHDHKYDGMTTEQVYKLLEKKNNQQKQELFDKCKDGSLNGNDITYPDQVDPGEAVTQDEVTKIILRAVTQAKAMGQPAGTMPAEIELALQHTLNPPLPWHIILSHYLTEFAKEDFTFRRPNRRFLPDSYLPTAHSEAVCNLAICVDISSSVTDHEFNVFITKIAEIKNSMNPQETTVVSFNTQITGVQKLTADDNPLTKLKFKGRGGTAIAPVLEWAAENKPTVMIIFTDGEFTQVEPKNKGVPMLWLIHDNPMWKTKWGRVIHYNITK
jgi:predicted metal-dependent peptidase